MSLLNTKTGFTTPWHCSVALTADGEWLSAPMGDFRKDPRYKIVYENGRSSYFVEATSQAVDIKLSVEKTLVVAEIGSQTRHKRNVSPPARSSVGKLQRE